jgi:thiol-disulfide isomerase/thioredoxin
MRSHFLPVLLVAVGSASAQDPAPKPPAGEPPKVEQPKPAAPKVLAVGEKLPAGLSLRGIDGKSYDLDSLRHRDGKGGKVVVLHFWSTTCPYEVAAEPKVNALTDEFRDQGVVVFGVAANAGEIGEKPADDAFETKDEAKLPYASLRKKAQESKINRTILVDHGGDTLGKLLDAKTTPHCYVIDAEGVLRYSGALDDDPQGKKEAPLRYVAAAVQALLAGEEPAVKTTKPYG